MTLTFAHSLAYLLSTPMSRPIPNQSSFIRFGIGVPLIVTLMLQRIFHIIDKKTDIALHQVPLLLFDTHHKQMHRVWEAFVFTSAAAIGFSFLSSKTFIDLDKAYHIAEKKILDQDEVFNAKSNLGARVVIGSGIVLFLFQCIAGFMFKPSRMVDHLLFYVPVWWTVYMFLRVNCMLTTILEAVTIKLKRKFRLHSTKFENSVENDLVTRSVLAEIFSNYRDDDDAKSQADLDLSVIKNIHGGIKTISHILRNIEQWWSFFVCYGFLTIVLYHRRTLDLISTLDTRSTSNPTFFGLPLKHYSLPKYLVWASKSIIGSVHTAMSSGQGFGNAMISVCRVIQPLVVGCIILGSPSMVTAAGKSLVHQIENMSDAATHPQFKSSHCQQLSFFESTIQWMKRQNIALNFSFDSKFLKSWVPKSVSSVFELKWLYFFLIFDQVWCMLVLED
jgi:hypothetical protein